MCECILTVSIAAYNVEQYIEDALEKFVNAKVERGSIEVEIVNDGSSDETLSIAQKYERNYPEIFRIFNKENGGWGSTVNKGIEEARGKYFKQLDGDDFYCENNISEFIEYLSRTESDIVISPYIAFNDADGKIISNVDFLGLKNVFEQNIEECIQQYPLLQMHAACIKTELLKNKVKITENCFYTDVEFMVKAILLCKTISYFDKEIYCYRLGRNDQSMCIEGLRRHYKEHGVITLLLDRLCLKLEEESAVSNIVKMRTIMMIEAQYKLFFLLDSKRKEIIAFDDELRQQESLYYCIRSRLIKILRLSNFGVYYFVRFIAKRHYEKSM